MLDHRYDNEPKWWHIEKILPGWLIRLAFAVLVLRVVADLLGSLS